MSISKEHVHVSHHPPVGCVFHHRVCAGPTNSGARRRRSRFSFRLRRGRRCCGCDVHVCHLEAMSPLMLLGFVFSKRTVYVIQLYSVMIMVSWCLYIVYTVTKNIYLCYLIVGHRENNS
uniref:Uncharacterized protein n=1 Tax=Phaseolus vulgaris TaxID=3885 RepID=V7BSU7_PHAVU|nr:hypothetical protein PHAVU_005G036100g [Phaseolus vulgaris]ESW21039.1 hypothetical protein PHAVU_005G036100g [Phaseolus vulgaris]